MLQSLAQIKTLFADGAWEGVVGNCDTFLYLGGNEASTFEYISKLLGKWTIDKKTNGESKGSSGSTSENYDVLGRELMNEYEVRLLPNDECILFVRGEEPLRDKKWHPWEHEEYNEVRAYVKEIRANEDEALLSDDEMRLDETNDEESEFAFINEDSLKYMKKQANAGQNIRIERIDAYDFMMLDLDMLNNPDEEGESERGDYHAESLVDIARLQELSKEEEESRYEQRKQDFLAKYDDVGVRRD